MKKDIKIDVSQAVCVDCVQKVREVLEYLKKEKIEIGLIEIFGDTFEGMVRVEMFLIEEGFVFEREGDENAFNFIIKERKMGELQEEEACFENKIFFFKSDSLGEGEIGVKLLEAFLANLINSQKLPKRIILINRGVLIAQNNAKNIENFNALRILEQRGVQICACQSCLKHFDLLENFSVGEIKDSNQILQMMLEMEVVSL